MPECNGDKCKNCDFCGKHNKLYEDIYSMKWRKALLTISLIEFALLVVIGVSSLIGDYKMMEMFKHFL